MNRQLLFPVLLIIISSVSINEVSAYYIPYIRDLRKLIGNRLIPDFQQALVLPDKKQFAVAILLPNSEWWKFKYHPSEYYGYYKGPVISSLSPPIQEETLYGNYLAARPRKVWKNGQSDILHSEIQILHHLENLYNASTKLYKKAPKVFLLYSWIVPCVSCTDAIYAKLTTSELFKSIPTKVIAYTTSGTRTRCKCNASYTWKKFKDTEGIELFDTNYYDNYMYKKKKKNGFFSSIQNFFAQLLG